MLPWNKSLVQGVSVFVCELTFCVPLCLSLSFSLSLALCYKGLFSWIMNNSHLNQWFHTSQTVWRNTSMLRGKRCKNRKLGVDVSEGKHACNGEKIKSTWSELSFIDLCVYVDVVLAYHSHCASLKLLYYSVSRQEAGWAIAWNSALTLMVVRQDEWLHKAEDFFPFFKNLRLLPAREN